MLITVEIKVKFRFWGMDLYKFDRIVNWAPGLPKAPAPLERVAINDHGVWLKVTVA